MGVPSRCKAGETEAGEACSSVGFFSQGLKRSDQVVLSFLNIYETGVLSHGRGQMCFEDVRYFQGTPFSSPKRRHRFKPQPDSPSVSQAPPSLGKAFMSQSDFPTRFPAGHGPPGLSLSSHRKAGLCGALWCRPGCAQSVGARALGKETGSETETHGGKGQVLVLGGQGHGGAGTVPVPLLRASS